MTCVLLSVSSVPHTIRSRGKINRILMAKQAPNTITIPFFCSCYQPIFYLHFFLKTAWINKIGILIYCLTNFSPMLHYIWRATRDMGKATYLYTFRFFFHIFFSFCCDAETQLFACSSIHTCFFTSPLLSILNSCHLFTPGLQTPERSKTRHNTTTVPYRGWVQTLVCVFISLCYIIAINVDKLPLILDFSKNLNYPLLSVPTVKLPYDPFLSKDKRKTNTEKVRKDQQHRPLVFCLLLCFLLDL